MSNGRFTVGPVVELQSLLLYSAGCELAVMRDDGKVDVVVTLVRLGIRRGRSPDERESNAVSFTLTVGSSQPESQALPHDVALDHVAVLVP